MSDQYVNLNGNLLEEKSCGLSIQNRAFKYGDGLFETIRVINGKALFIEDHFSRLKRGMIALNYELPSFWNQSYMKKEIVKVMEKNGLERGGRIRFTVFRKGEGYYMPKSNEFGFIIEAKNGEENSYYLNEQGLKLGIFDEVRLHANKFSPFKTNQCLPYIAAGTWARQSDFDDVLLLNDKGNVVEGISSNLFVFIDGILYTPPLSEGPVSGIMRKKVIQLAKKGNLSLVETAISPDVLNDAEEIFLTNAINGIRWVSQYKKKRFFHRLSQSFTDALNKISA